MTDPIADMLTRIHNGYLAHKGEVSIPYSKLKESIAQLLKKEGYVTEVEIKADEDNAILKNIVVGLRYVGKQPAMTGVKRLSKPGLRKYIAAKKIPKSLGGYGVTIVSTSAGILGDKEARAKGVGGELLCSIW